MLIRKKKNKSNTLSIQVISKSRGKYKVIRTIGYAKTKREEEPMVFRLSQFTMP